MKLNQYELICFDWDGTLVASHDTYRLCDQFLICNNYKKDVSIDELNAIVSDYWNKYGINGLDYYYRDWAKLFNNNIDKEIIKSGFDFFLKEIPYKEHAIHVLKLLKKQNPNIKTALVTGSRRSELELYSTDRSQTGRLLKPAEYFDLIITRDDVKQTKPNPEPYQIAINHFNMIESLDKILVIEDSMIGAIAAYLAGIKNIGIIQDNHSDFERYDLKKFNKYYWESWRDFEQEMLND